MKKLTTAWYKKKDSMKLLLYLLIHKISNFSEMNWLVQRVFSTMVAVIGTQQLQFYDKDCWFIYRGVRVWAKIQNNSCIFSIQP